ncbi:MAG: Na(+)/H(+) antiporter NhaA, partial [Alcaligenes sp.]
MPEKEWNFADVGIQLARFYQAGAPVRGPAPRPVQVKFSTISDVNKSHKGRPLTPQATPHRPVSFLQAFLRSEALGGYVLMAAALVALIIANSP